LNVQLVPYNKIDKQKWDACITNASNGLVYAYSFYLYAMAKHWEALVLNDYEIVMPLTYNKKYGICYLYQPPFTAQLGVFGNELTKETIEKFVNAIPAKYKYRDIYFNYKNTFPLNNFYERSNYVLNLNKPYEELYRAFKENVKRNIKKCSQLNCNIKKNISIDDVIALAKEQTATFSKLSNQDFEAIKKVYTHLKQNNDAITYGVYLNDQLVASAAFFFSNNRAYYILVGNHPNGKTIGASHTLINEFIKDNANKNLVLDFEGSDIGSLAFFYSSFGAVEEKFAAIKYNNLPWFLKWLKK
jgi:hypothetical protein